MHPLKRICHFGVQTGADHVPQQGVHRVGKAPPNVRVQDFLLRLLLSRVRNGHELLLRNDPPEIPPP
eukprot:scaffold1445_cov235-Pinguiococcus_pyrenoidosus.AAC.8